MVNYLEMGGSNGFLRSEEHTSELQSPVPISYAVFCLKKKKKKKRDRTMRKIINTGTRNTQSTVKQYRLSTKK